LYGIVKGPVKWAETGTWKKRWSTNRCIMTGGKAKGLEGKFLFETRDP